MDDARFQDLVDRLGEDLRLWPDPDRAAGEALLRHSATARTILATAVALRETFDATATVKAPAGLAARIIALADDEAPSDAADNKPASHTAA